MCILIMQSSNDPNMNVFLSYGSENVGASVVASLRKCLELSELLKTFLVNSNLVEQ